MAAVAITSAAGLRGMYRHNEAIRALAKKGATLDSLTVRPFGPDFIYTGWLLCDLQPETGFLPSLVDSHFALLSPKAIIFSSAMIEDDLIKLRHLETIPHVIVTSDIDSSVASELVSLSGLKQLSVRASVASPEWVACACDARELLLLSIDGAISAISEQLLTDSLPKCRVIVRR